jgi:hypothetical protein
MLTLQEKNAAFKKLADALDTALEHAPAVVLVYEDGTTDLRFLSDRGLLSSRLFNLYAEERAKGKILLGTIRCVANLKGKIKYVVAQVGTYSERLTLDMFSERYVEIPPLTGER